MQGPARARIRPRRWLTAITAALIAAAGVQLALGSTATATAANPAPSSRDARAGQHGTATVTVQIKGLPRNVRANVKLTGPGKKSRRITTTAKLTGVAPGAYTASAQAVVWHASTYRPTVTVCSASGRCSSPSHGRITVKEHQRLTVAVTYAVAKRVTAPNTASPGGTLPPVGPTQLTPGILAPGASETGGWSASIDIPAGGPQAQVDAVVSFPIPLNEIMNHAHTVYLNERQVQEPGTVPGCNGSANAPVAEPGYLCVYQGATATPGSLVSEWKNAGFFALEDFAGNIRGGRLGELVVFRTTTFTEAPTTIPAAAALTAAGSWAVTEKA